MTRPTPAWLRPCILDQISQAASAEVIPRARLLVRGDLPGMTAEEIAAVTPQVNAALANAQPSPAEAPVLRLKLTKAFVAILRHSRKTK